ncbi:beta-galactosidase [Corynebacterium sp. CCUG 65737]|uniref:beta-galactosidase n=1 Tax=Corynebacterium sp. CCUG 65737 TaxID=2823889 RepID=UPI00210BC3F4|nr:beta-galactosidase [Corynebacterium sp. CCUG 65737]MCQ4626912.1 beta-galactosidase [Corynebacterium sp. CCUG 65737]
MDSRTSGFARLTQFLQALFPQRNARNASLATCVITALTASFLVAPQAQAEDTTTYRGTNGIGIVTKHVDDATSVSEVEESFRTAKEMGVEWTRVGAPWYHIERERGHYNWKFLDQTVEIAKKYDIKVMMQVSTAPQWATSVGDMSEAEKNSLDHYKDTYAPKPEYYNDYGRYFADVVNRYSAHGIVDYEVWNEPSMQGFWRESSDNPNPSPESYTKLLQATYPKAHAANPNVNVIAGGQVVLPTYDDGTVVNGVEYLERMYDAGAKGNFDSLAHHPYGIGAEYWEYNGWAYMFDEPKTKRSPGKSLHSVMSAHGDGHKEIWLTETGQDTLNANEQVQAETYQDYMEAWNETPNLGPIIFYQLHDRKPYGSNDKEDYFGVLRADGSWKPAAHTIKNFTGGDDATPVESGAVPPADDDIEVDSGAPLPQTEDDIEVDSGAPVPAEGSEPSESSEASQPSKPDSEEKAEANKEKSAQKSDSGDSPLARLWTSISGFLRNNVWKKFLDLFS